MNLFVKRTNDKLTIFRGDDEAPAFGLDAESAAAAHEFVQKWMQFIGADNDYCHVMATCIYDRHRLKRHATLTTVYACYGPKQWEKIQSLTGAAAATVDTALNEANPHVLTVINDLRRVKKGTYAMKSMAHHKEGILE